MAQPTIIPTDLVVQGNASFASLTVPSGAIKDANVAAAAAIQSAKIIGPRSISRELYTDAATVAALTTNLTTIAGASGTLIDFSAWITTAATGSDRTIGVDLQIWNGSTWGTVLSAPIAFSNASAIKTPVKGTITSAALAAGNLLRVVVTVAGSLSAQALGLFITLRHDESYT